MEALAISAANLTEKKDKIAAYRSLVRAELVCKKYIRIKWI